MTADNARNIINKLLNVQEKVISGQEEDVYQLLNVVIRDVFDAAYFDSGTNLGQKEWAKENWLRFVQLPEP